MGDATIIKAMRCCGRGYDCEGCPLSDGVAIDNDELCDATRLAAADRIEALGREVEELKTSGHFTGVELAQIAMAMRRLKALEEKLKGISLDEAVDAFVNALNQINPEPLRKARIIWNADEDWCEQITADRDQWRKRAADAECDIEHLARGEYGICAMCAKVGKSKETACVYGCYMTDGGNGAYITEYPDEPCDRFEYRIDKANVSSTIPPAQGAPFDEGMGGTP